MNYETHPTAAPFGTLLGIAPGGVPVYSCDHATVERAGLTDRQSFRSYVDGEFMGYKWQCVEFARRWLYAATGCVFDDIPMAYDIFRLRTVRRVADGARLPLRSFRNGARRPPEPGALLIWNEGGEFDVTGHVAVVTEVFPDRVRCVEQNVENSIWPDGREWSRELRAHLAADGGYRIECSYGDAEILGWVIQTDDATHAEAIVDADPHLFNLQVRELGELPDGPDMWLDPKCPEDAAYVAMMKGCRLSGDPAHRGRYFRIGETARKELKRATNELHRMFLVATDFVLRDDSLLGRFHIPPVLWPRIRASWNNRRNHMITGRFDFSVSERGIKVYEYNADSASCHMECGRVQDAWARRFGCVDGRSSGDGLHAALVAAWRKSEVDGVLHILRDRDPEETYHSLYMKSAIEAAGIPCKVITGFEGLGWDADGCVVDADGARIDWVWKTWAWETALDQLRDECDEDDECERLHRPRARRDGPPRLIDILLRKDVMVFEPLWTLIPSNKAILPVMSAMFPKHPYLLDTQAELTDELAANGYVAKPIVGRCGANIAIVDHNSEVVSETAGGFDDRDQIYQELFPLPCIGGENVQIGTFSVDGAYAGANVRVDPSPIIRNHSEILALRIVEDAELAPGT